VFFSEKGLFFAGITERSRTAVKGLTIAHDDAVDDRRAVGKPEIVAKAAQSVSKWAPAHQGRQLNNFP
jgi:hypothetical protein